MAITQHAHFTNEQLCSLLMQSRQSEVDLQERVAARAIHVGGLSDDKLAGSPDPVRKRLAFLLQKRVTQRRDTESELATREDVECSQ